MRIHFNGLSYNQVLSTIEKNTFEATTELEELRLSHNPGLYWLHPEAWPLATLNTSLSWRLRSLDLSSCGLSYLPSMLPPSFNDWFKLAALHLADNPWQCDCHNTWLMQKLIPDIHSKTPELLQGKPLWYEVFEAPPDPAGINVKTICHSQMLEESLSP